jgi:hypothetical protein
MLRKCIDCEHCKSVIKHYDNVPEFFSRFLEFYCLKDNKHLGHMVKKKDEVEYLPCFKKRPKEQIWQ